MLADRSGPPGPAMILAVAYALGARDAADRVAAVDAFLTLPAHAGPVGAALGDLCSDGTVKLNRVAAALTGVHQAGAVWQLLAAAILPLLATTPRGLPDLLELATHVATALDIRADLPHLADLARRPGNTRLLREARRLQAALS
ncbi:hypothetical protein [Actinoplanes subglobosus]|uniref:Uncharacterized protein n=1 Tax=Actinoplanes subglobosus TaxID=1547892 RepID=A0ABV8IGX3_9ACTN